MEENAEGGSTTKPRISFATSGSAKRPAGGGRGLNVPIRYPVSLVLGARVLGIEGDYHSYVLSKGL